MPDIIYPLFHANEVNFAICLDSLVLCVLTPPVVSVGYVVEVVPRLRIM